MRSNLRILPRPPQLPPVVTPMIIADLMTARLFDGRMGGQIALTKGDLRDLLQGAAQVAVDHCGSRL